MGDAGAQFAIRRVITNPPHSPDRDLFNKLGSEKIRRMPQTYS